MTYKNLNNKKDMEMIILANELPNYQPTKTRGDKYFQVISQNYISEIAENNRSAEIIKWICFKRFIGVELYKNILNEIGFMLMDYISKKLKAICDKTLSDYSDYEIVIKKDWTLLDVAMGKVYEKCGYWYLEPKKDKVSLVFFKDNKKGDLIKCRSKKEDNDIDVSDGKCYQIGMAKIVVCDWNKKIYVLSAYDELLFVKKNIENQYQFYKRIA